eukprot:CAMPEP_0114172164 /NCGR_PEP_ID=MMETSP0043_2-20121206/35104_1 /TAXON_ID=464988 /ORGANISM="Hemiselmis andersenii, Strain CCMP644" /LENGTH=75 /DNA_ID=CAMNT_0001269971 /DNA_START=1 /DNA_END=225 /DNA_ORIENTATION=+
MASFLLLSRRELYTAPEQHLKLILNLLGETRWAPPPNTLMMHSVAVGCAPGIPAEACRAELLRQLERRRSLRMRE